MARFVVYEKSTGNILRAQEGWKGDITDDDKDRILSDHGALKPTLDLYVLPDDSSSLPDDTTVVKTVNGKVQFALKDIGG